MSALLDAALTYARNGLSVIPLKPNSKLPLLVAWKDFQRKRMAEADITGFWTDTPNANIGIVTGKISEISVVDIDGQTGVESLRNAGIKLPATRIFKTPHGWHHVYRYTEQLHQGAAFAPGVDCRSEGGYIVAPPSVVWPCTKTMCGIPEADHSYRVLHDNPIAPYTDVPELFARKTRASPELGDRPEWVARALIEGAGYGQRNDLASRIAGYFRSLNLPQDITLAALKQFADACDPPMPYDELQDTVRSIWRYTPSRPTSYQGQSVDAPIVDESIGTRRLFQWPNTGVLIRAERIKEHSDGVTCWLTIGTSVGEIYGPVSFNLLADRSRTTLAKSLRDRHEANWLAYLDTISKHIVHSLTQSGLSEDAAQIIPQESGAWLAYPVLKSQQASLLYADGGTGKSTWSTTLAASMALGQSLIPGLNIDAPIPCLYLDWEGSRDEFGTLRRAIETGYGVKLPKDRLRYRRMRLPLPDELDSVLREITEWNIGAVIIDSIVGAAGEDVEKAEGARLHFNCLAQMNIASLNITHITKDGKNVKPYGSVFYWNYARSVWFGKRDEDENAFAIYHRKANYSKLFKPQTWLVDTKVNGSHELLSLQFRNANVQDYAPLAAATRLVDRIEGLVRHGAMHYQEIADELDVPVATVRQTVGRWIKKDRFVLIPPDMAIGLPQRQDATRDTPIFSVARHVAGATRHGAPLQGEHPSVAPSQPSTVDDKEKVSRADQPLWEEIEEAMEEAQ